ncbi:MAG: glycosyltransferase family 4 protein [bacterium]
MSAKWDRRTAWIICSAIRRLVYDLGRTDFYCVIIGSGDAFDDLQKLKRKLRIEDYVLFTGIIPFDDLLCYLSTADICVDPDPSSPLNDVSTWIKIMEYMALKKPIVTFDLAETRYSAQNAALYVQPNDEMAFAQAIARPMDDPELRAELGAYGYRRVKNELSWQHVSKNLLHAYSALFKTTNAVAAIPNLQRDSEYARSRVALESDA